MDNRSFVPDPEKYMPLTERLRLSSECFRFMNNLYINFTEETYQETSLLEKIYQVQNLFYSVF